MIGDLNASKTNWRTHKWKIWWKVKSENNNLIVEWAVSWNSWVNTAASFLLGVKLQPFITKHNVFRIYTSIWALSVVFFDFVLVQKQLKTRQHEVKNSFHQKDEFLPQGKTVSQLSCAGDKDFFDSVRTWTLVSQVEIVKKKQKNETIWARWGASTVKFEIAVQLSKALGQVQKEVKP